VNIPKDR